MFGKPGARRAGLSAAGHAAAGGAAASGAVGVQAGGRGPTTKTRGDTAEDHALAWLLQRGLVLVQRNYRVARGPHARGGEIDLVMRDGDGTLVFVEVRARAATRHGGAAASIGATKQRSLLLAAQHFLLRYPAPPPCRFDVLAIDGGQVQWLQAAFSA